MATHKPVLRDFYAAAIALFAVIVFAKFFAHERRKRRHLLLKVGHVLCVFLSAVGVALSLLVSASTNSSASASTERGTGCSARPSSRW